MENGEVEAGRLYINVFDLMQDLSKSANTLSVSCTNHVINHHDIPSREYLSVVVELDAMLTSYFNKIMDSIEKLSFEDHELIGKESVKITDYLNDQIDNQIKIIQKQEVGSRNGMLQTRVLLESRDIVRLSLQILESYVDYARKD
jgi:hypothetical protein